MHSLGHAHDVVISFDFRQGIDYLLLAWGFDALGQVPSLRGEVRALEDGQGGSEADRRWRLWVVKKVAQCFDGAGRQVAHTVLQSLDIFALGFLHSGFEYRLGPEPVVDCGAVDTSVAGCVSDGTPLSKGGYDLGLSRRQGCIRNCVGFR